MPGENYTAKCYSIINLHQREDEQWKRVPNTINPLRWHIIEVENKSRANVKKDGINNK